MPVPSSSLPWDFTSMETTAGITLFTSCGMVTLPLSTAAPGVAPLSWMVTPSLLPLLLLSARAVTPAPTAPPMRAATRATGSQTRDRALTAAPADRRVSERGCRVGEGIGVRGAGPRSAGGGRTGRGGGVHGRRPARTEPRRRGRRLTAVGRRRRGGGGVGGGAAPPPGSAPGCRGRSGVASGRRRPLAGRSRTASPVRRRRVGGWRRRCLGCTGSGRRPWLLGVLAHVDPPEGRGCVARGTQVVCVRSGSGHVRRTCRSMLRDAPLGARHRGFGRQAR